MRSVGRLARMCFPWWGLFVACCFLALPSFAEDSGAPLRLTGADALLARDFEPCDSDGVEKEEQRRWFVFLGLVNAYPRMESEKLVHTYFDRAMRALAPGFDDVRTVRSLRDDHLLWVPQVGLGRVTGKHLTLYVQGGSAAGKVRTKANDRSIFLLPLHTDFEIRRGATSATIGADYYPFGVVKLRKYEGFWERLRAAQPKLGASFTFTQASFRVKVKVGIKNVVNLLDLELSDSWPMQSINTNAGFDVPLGTKTSIGFNGGYNFFFSRQEDFEGPSFSITYNYFFH